MCPHLVSALTRIFWPISPYRLHALLSRIQLDHMIVKLKWIMPFSMMAETFSRVQLNSHIISSTQ